MCFLYPDEVEEKMFMWCCGFFQRMKKRGDKVIKVHTKWYEQFVVRGESYRMEEIFKKKWNLAHLGKRRGGMMCKDT